MFVRLRGESPGRNVGEHCHSEELLIGVGVTRHIRGLFPFSSEMLEASLGQ